MSDRFKEAAGHHRDGRLAEADALYRAVIADDPNHADALHLLGVVAGQTGRFEDAITYIGRAVEASPREPHYRHNLGNALLSLGRLGDAEQSFRAALTLKPDHTEAHHSLGNVYLSLGRLAEAETCFRDALRIEPAYVEAMTSLGATLHQGGRPAEAAAYYRAAITRAPMYAMPRHNLASLFHAEGRAADASKNMEHAVALDPGDPKLHATLITTQALDPTLTMRDLTHWRDLWATRFADPITRAAEPVTRDRDPRRRLRIGYLAGGMYRYSTGAMALLPQVEAHDRSGFDVVCYSDLPPERGDDITERFRRAATYRETQGLSDADLARLINEDRIDILVDTYGHAGGSRLLAMAHRAAPIQMSLLTMGPERMAALDYTLANVTVTPGWMLKEYRERVIRLPAPYPFAPLRSPPAPNPVSAFERNGYVTFGSFHRLSKLNQPVLDAWAEILRRAPGAKLLIKAGHGSAAYIPAFIERVQQTGFPADCVLLRGWSETAAEHLAAHDDIDIGLDTFPYGGITTVCEALMMGAPVVTFAADRPLGRYGAGILRSVGLDELATETTEDYVAAAVALAGDHARRLSVRRGLPERFATSRLAQGRLVARDLERVYRAVWRRWCATGQAFPPRSHREHDATMSGSR